jgi:hypothetical protein
MLKNEKSPRTGQDDQMARTKEIMRRLAETPHKPHRSIPAGVTAYCAPPRFELRPSGKLLFGRTVDTLDQTNPEVSPSPRPSQSPRRTVRSDK